LLKFDLKPAIPLPTQFLPFEREQILDAEWQLSGTSIGFGKTTFGREADTG
jgi:hypothetical protein